MQGAKDQELYNNALSFKPLNNSNLLLYNWQLILQSAWSNLDYIRVNELNQETKILTACPVWYSSISKN